MDVGELMRMDTITESDVREAVKAGAGYDRRSGRTCLMVCELILDSLTGRGPLLVVVSSGSQLVYVQRAIDRLMKAGGWTMKPNQSLVWPLMDTMVRFAVASNIDRLNDVLAAWSSWQTFIDHNVWETINESFIPSREFVAEQSRMIQKISTLCNVPSEVVGKANHCPVDPSRVALLSGPMAERLKRLRVQREAGVARGDKGGG